MFSSCKKVKLQQSETGRPIQIFELQVTSSSSADMNVAEGKIASQSSTFISPSGDSFDAVRAIDGKPNTFSHTAGANSWLEVDLEQVYSVDSVKILNRWCRKPSDPRGCLCRLSGAILALIDDSGEEISSITIRDTCGKLTLEYVFDPSPEFCLPTSVSFFIVVKLVPLVL
jgi:hypothetical protein